MTPLRQRMIEDMRVRNLATLTQKTYLQHVALCARHFGRSPDRLGPEEIRSYQVYLTTEKKLATSSILIAVAALRFLYKVTLKKDWAIRDLPAPRKPQKLPVILSREEGARFLGSVNHLQHRTFLTVCSAAGLRISEATHLKITDIDSQRRMIRVEQGKGQKDRYVMLSPKLLEQRRTYWKAHRPKEWLFAGNLPDRPIGRHALERACQKYHRRCGIPKPLTPHSLRHAFATPLLESGAEVRTIQLLLGHRSLATTARYLKLATHAVCATPSPWDLIAHAEPPSPEAPPAHR